MAMMIVMDLLSLRKVPADMVVNATLAAVAKHAQALGVAPEMHIYHVGSSTSNPLMCRDMVSFFFQHFTRYPLSLAAGQPIKVAPMRLFSSMQQFSGADAFHQVRREDHPPTASMAAGGSAFYTYLVARVTNMDA
jgi:hypothetical protein